MHFIFHFRLYLWGGGWGEEFFKVIHSMDLKEESRLVAESKLQKVTVGRAHWLICSSRFEFAASFIFLWGWRIVMFPGLNGWQLTSELLSKRWHQNGSGSCVSAPWCRVGCFGGNEEIIFVWEGRRLRKREREKSCENYIISNFVISCSLLRIYFPNDFTAPYNTLINLKVLFYNLA